MSKLALNALWGGAGVAGLVAVAFATGGLQWPAAPQPDNTAETAQAAEPGAQDQAPTQPSAPIPAEAALEPTADPEPQIAALGAPGFDIVRSEPGGATLVAGYGQAGAVMQLLIDGQADGDASVPVPGDGKFVLFVDLDPAAGPRVLTLRQTLDDAVALSTEEIIVTPQPALSDPALSDPALSDTVPEAQTEIAEGTGHQPDAETMAALDPLQPEASASLPAGSAAPSLSDTADTAPEAERSTVAAAPTPTEPDSSAIQDVAQDVRQDTAAATSAEAGDAPTAPPVLLSSASGVEVLQTAPLAPGAVALDSISYDSAGDVLLAGRGGDAGFVRVYLDNSPVTTSRIRSDGRWRVELPEVETGTYTLRVDQLDVDGAVTARVESPFLRESPEALAAASTRNAASAAPLTAITVQPGHTLWAIARDRYGDGVEYLRVFRANRDRIRNPDLIYPGQIFDLPTPD
ncbi:MAG: LysM peptidoglycan-binding domain-containing protein [Pelagimonas sp.]|jgi:nucleoid-associated protein YgaU|nr:LysM peptidoglycan-binding domain-containing protein [Pelagimonas sp.]